MRPIRKIQKQFGKNIKIKLGPDEPSFKRGFWGSKTFWKGKTQKAAIKQEKEVFHGKSSLKLQESVLKEKKYEDLLSQKQKELKKITNEGVVGAIRGKKLFRIRSANEIKARALVNNVRYLTSKQKQYSKKSASSLNWDRRGTVFKTLPVVI